LTSGILSDTLEVKGDKMKYVIRRAVLGVVATPIVAGAWVLFIAVLIGLGAEPTANVSQVWNDGLGLGVIVAVLFTFGPLIVKDNK
jgi:hypothetical protein